MLKFVKLKKQHLQLVLDWRTSPEITRLMSTDIEYNLENQKAWFKKISIDNTCKYWVIEYKQKLVGVISLHNIDYHHGSCYGGYYIGDLNYRAKLGGLIPLLLLKYVFSTENLNKHIADVFTDNKKVLDLYKSYGYREVGVLRRHIRKNNKWHDMTLLEFTSEHWTVLKEKYLRYDAVFEQ